MNSFLLTFLKKLESEGIAYTIHDFERIRLVIECKCFWTLRKLRFALSALLIKNRKDESAFNRCFIQYFNPENCDETKPFNLKDFIRRNEEEEKKEKEIESSLYFPKTQVKYTYQCKSASTSKKKTTTNKLLENILVFSPLIIPVLILHIVVFLTWLIGTPEVEVKPEALHFTADTNQHYQEKKVITLINKGFRNLKITSYEIVDTSGSFSIKQSFPITIGSLWSKEREAKIDIVFNRKTNNKIKAELFFRTNDPQNPWYGPLILTSDEVIGALTFYPSPLTLKSGEDNILTIKNTGIERSIIGFNTESELAGDFRLDLGQELPVVLPPDSEKKIKIYYDTDVTKEQRGTISFASTAADSPHVIELIVPEKIDGPKYRLYENISINPQNMIEVVENQPERRLLLIYTALFAFFFFLLISYFIFILVKHTYFFAGKSDFDRAGPRLFHLELIGGNVSSLLNKYDLDHLADSISYFTTDERSKKPDVPKSIEATCDKGLPTITYQRKRRLRSLIILEDIYSETSEWNFAASELSVDLARRGISVIHGNFRGNLEEIYLTGGQYIALEDLEEYKNGSIIMIFSDTKRLYNYKDSFALDYLSTWKAVVWMEPREPKFWDHSTTYVTSKGIPLYPASKQGIEKAFSRFMSEEGGQRDYSDYDQTGRMSLRQTADPSYVINLLGDTLGWARDCSLIQPLPLGLADALRREYHSHLPVSRLERLFMLPGTTRSVEGLCFSFPVLSILKNGFCSIRTKEEQKKVITFILQKIDEAKPVVSKEKITMQEISWRYVRARVKMEVDPDEALKELALLYRYPIKKTIGVQLKRFTFWEKEKKDYTKKSIPLCTKPKRKESVIMKKRMEALKKNPFPPLKKHHFAFFSLFGVLSLVFCVMTLFTIFLPTKNNHVITFAGFNKPMDYSLILETPQNKYEVAAHTHYMSVKINDIASDVQIAKQDLSEITIAVKTQPGTHALSFLENGITTHYAIDLPENSNLQINNITGQIKNIEKEIYEEYPEIGLTIIRAPPDITNNKISLPSWQEQKLQFASDLTTDNLMSVGLEFYSTQSTGDSSRLQKVLLETGSVDMIFQVKVDINGMWQEEAVINKIKEILGPFNFKTQLIWWANLPDSISEDITYISAVQPSTIPVEHVFLDTNPKIFDKGDQVCLGELSDLNRLTDYLYGDYIAEGDDESVIAYGLAREAGYSGPKFYVVGLNVINLYMVETNKFLILNDFILFRKSYYYKRYTFTTDYSPKIENIVIRKTETGEIIEDLINPLDTDQITLQLDVTADNDFKDSYSISITQNDKYIKRGITVRFLQNITEEIKLQKGVNKFKVRLIFNSTARPEKTVAVEKEIILTYEPPEEKSLNLLRTIDGHSDAVTSVCFADDRRLMLSGSWDKTMKEWFLETGLEYISHDSIGKVNAVDCFYGNRTLIYAWGNSEGIVQWQIIEDGNDIIHGGAHKGAVNSIAISPDGQALASCGEDQTVRIWEVHSGQELFTIPLSSSISSISYAPSGYYLAVAMDTRIVLWYSKTKELHQFGEGHISTINTITHSPNGLYIASGGKDDQVIIWSAEKHNKIFDLTGHTGGIQSVCFSPDGRYLASSDGDGAIKIWSIKEGKLLQTFIAHDDSVLSICFSPDGKNLASGSADSTIKIWDTGPTKQPDQPPEVKIEKVFSKIPDNTDNLTIASQLELDKPDVEVTSDTVEINIKLVTKSRPVTKIEVIVNNQPVVKKTIEDTKSIYSLTELITLTSGKNYFKIAAYDTQGNRGETKEQVISYKLLSPAPPLGTPQNVKASPGPKGNFFIRVTFDEVRRAVLYDIYRSDSPDGPFVKVAETKNNFYDDTNAVPGKNYYYRVQAFSSKSGTGGNSLFSSTSNAGFYYKEYYSFDLAWGSYGAGENQFNNLTSIAIDSNDSLYIVDYGKGAIIKSNTEGKLVGQQWFTEGIVDIQKHIGTYNISIDSQDTIFLSLLAFNQVLNVDSEGNIIEEYKVKYNPVGVVKDSLGAIYIGDITSNKIKKYTDSTTEFDIVWGEFGEENGQFNEIHGLGIDSQDRIYVVDHKNHRIQVFSNDGTFLFTIGSFGIGIHQFSFPENIHIDTEDYIFIADTANDRIVKYDSEWNFVTQIDLKDSEEGALNRPFDMCTDSKGNLYVVDRENQRIVKLKKSKEFQ